MNLFGVKIVTNDAMVDRAVEQIRFPRSKKKRICKKWRKDPRNWCVRVTPSRTVMRFGDTWIMHSTVARQLQEEILRRNRLNQIMHGSMPSLVLSSP